MKRELDNARLGRGISADDSYREILGAESWNRLKPEVRQRFSAKPKRGKAIRYVGTMQRVELSWAGWFFAQVCRLIGTPLAPWRGTDVPMTIELSPDEALHGVAWKRCYQFPPTKSFTVRSTKCKGKDGEFIEHIGRGFSMRLRLSERKGSLIFTSVAYEVAILNRVLCIPTLLTPGTTTVTHEQLTGNRFRFTLSVNHPLLGRTIYQDGEFYSVVRDR
jgi:hypothetical protein